jgi:uncharacterized protein YcbX
VSQPVFDLEATIARLFVYPVKSCAGVELNEMLLTETGLEFDRAWMVVDANGEFVTQRQIPRMALIRPQMKHMEVVLRAPGMLALHLAFDRVEKPVRVRVWKDEVAAYDMGDIAAQWFSDFLSEPGKPQTLRLVRFDPEHKRLSSLKWTDGVEALNQFADGYPLLVASEGSLAELNERLAAAGTRRSASSASGPTSCWPASSRMTKTASMRCMSPRPKARPSSSRSSPARAARFPTSTRPPP